MLAYFRCNFHLFVLVGGVSAISVPCLPNKVGRTWPTRPVDSPAVDGTRLALVLVLDDKESTLFYQRLTAVATNRRRRIAEAKQGFRLRTRKIMTAIVRYLLQVRGTRYYTRRAGAEWSRNLRVVRLCCANDCDLVPGFVTGRQPETATAR